jgi:hypothetical protein
MLATLGLAGWLLRPPQADTPILSGPVPLAPSGAPAGDRGGPGKEPAVLSKETVYANGIVVGSSYQNDLSPPLRDIKPIPAYTGPQAPERENPPIPLAGHQDMPDPVVQHSFGLLGEAVVPNMPAPSTSWNGINQASGCGGCAPPDTNGDVGPNHYVQTVNSAFQIWNKSGASLYGPAAINTIWSGFGGPCQTRNDGDPVVLYDQLAGRWLMSQFTSAAPYNECIAISQTGDPTGAWYRYAFQLSTSNFPDYPHFGVWPDGYYMSVNQFNNGSTYAGPRPYVFDRAKMLLGQPATFQTTANALGSSVSPIHPADLDGAILPPAGTPNFFVRFGSSIGLYKFSVNWTNPAATTWTNSANLTAAGFTQLCTTTRNCIPQPSTTTRLDGIGDRFMHRLAYRRFSDGRESMVINHSVNAGSGVAGVRWYEIRNPSTTPSIYQQGTYAPDSAYRWMGSIAMDKDGNMALGYSVSSSTVNPSIRYTGRLATDALGAMPQGETTLLAGTGRQVGVNRWGDYSSMSIDPSDDCTFWYTQEYNNSGAWAWSTRIGAFKFPSCGGAPTPTATNTPPPGPTNTPTRTPTATPTRTPTPPPSGCTERITNGGFESGTSPWVQSSSGGYQLIATTRPRTGSYSAYLGDYNNAVDSIYQQITIPSTATSATLSYWWYMSTQETSHPWDYMYVRILNSSGTVLATLQTLSDGSTANTWTQASHSLLAYKGQTIRVQFRVTNDSSLPTAFFVDDVSVNTCQ